jgi:hypothetical protein
MPIADGRLPNCSTWNNFSRRADASRYLQSTRSGGSVRLLHTNFHALDLPISTLHYQNLGELFHVEQSIYPRECTNFRRCGRQKSALFSVK